MRRDFTVGCCSNYPLRLRFHRITLFFCDLGVGFLSVKWICFSLFHTCMMGENGFAFICELHVGDKRFSEYDFQRKSVTFVGFLKCVNEII